MALRRILLMAVRAYTISFINHSGTTMTLMSSNTCSGEWSAGKAPPSSIPSGSTVTIGSESDGFLTGTEGFVIYKCQDPSAGVTQLYLYWDNPYIGTTRAGSLISTADISSIFLQGNCSASYPDSSGSGFAPPPSSFVIQPASSWSSETSGGTLSYLYPASSGAGETGEAWKQLSSGLINPVFWFADVFGNVGNEPDALNYFLFSLQPPPTGTPASMRKFFIDRGADLTKGLRELIIKPANSASISARAMMGLS